MKNKNLYEYYGYMEGWLSIAVNSVLFVLKLWAGISAGSVAVIADAWHTLSDSLSSVVVLLGVKISSKPADNEHPYGHGRAELIGSIIIAVLLAVVAGNLVMESINKILNYAEASFSMFTIVAISISIFAKEALARFAIHFGKKINSKSLIADGWHHRSDSISSIIILLGIFLGSYFWWIDSILGIFVSLVLFYAAYEIMKNTVNAFIGEKLDDDLIEKIKNIVHSIHPGGADIHHIHMHEYGHHCEITFHIRLPDEMGLNDAHEIASNIERTIMDKMHCETTIHIEPQRLKPE